MFVNGHGGNAAVGNAALDMMAEYVNLKIKFHAWYAAPKTMRAASRLGVCCITASGGVTCNSGLRAALSIACKREGFNLRLANPVLCTDNAAMAGLAWESLNAGQTAELDLDVVPGLVRRR